MKVATKFALAFLVCAVFSVTVYSAVAASREVDRLESTVASDLASLGRTLSITVEAVWQHDGEARALEIVGYHDRADAVDIRWTWLDVDGADTHAPRGGFAVVPSLLRGQPQTWVGVRADGARQIYAYVPISHGRAGMRPAALELSRPLVREADLFWQETREQLLTWTLVAGFAAFCAIVLTTWIISAPLARVTEQARRVGAGDLSRRLPVPGGHDARHKDEVATLIVELNAMCDQLRDARTRAEEETEKRVAAIEELRHADRLRTVGTLASGIAHELGTPLNVISMRAKLIASGESGAEAAADAKIIASQSERVTKIVRQLLDFARRRTPQRRDVDLSELVAHATNLLGGLAKKARVDVRVENDAKVAANVDPMQIEQCVTNLVVNAIHAMPDGGTVTVSARRARARDKDCVAIAVADTGSGISRDDLERIYEPFFTTKAVGDGTGLGLPVTHGIVEDHGGFIDVTSELGAGTTFTLFLPV